MAATLTAQPVNYNLPGAYQGQQVDAENAYQQALTSIAQRQSSLAHDTGFTYNQGADGNVNGVQIDPNNQYSQVMSLLGGHAANIRNLRDNLAGRGLTGSTGLAGKRAALMRFVQTGETSGLGTNFLNNLSGLFNEKSQALSTRNTTFTNAEQSALLYALQNQMFNTPQATPNAATGDLGGGAAGQAGYTSSYNAADYNQGGNPTTSPQPLMGGSFNLPSLAQSGTSGVGTAKYVQPNTSAAIPKSAFNIPTAPISRAPGQVARNSF